MQPPTLDSIDQFAYSDGEQANPTPSLSPLQRRRFIIEKKRSKRDTYTNFEARKMFSFWCGNDNEGLCPFCKKQTIIRKERHTWDAAHIASWSSGGSNALYNVFPCCLACNRQVEFGGRAYGENGANHFDGIVMGGFHDVTKFGAILGSFMHQCYDWLFASGERLRRASPESESRIDVLRAYYGPGVPGGWKQSLVEETYVAWLAVQNRLQEYRSAIRAAQLQVESAQKAFQEAVHAEDVFRKKHSHFVVL